MHMKDSHGQILALASFRRESSYFSKKFSLRPDANPHTPNCKIQTRKREPDKAARGVEGEETSVLRVVHEHGAGVAFHLVEGLEFRV